MTDEQIIKALECCVKDDEGASGCSEKCPLFDTHKDCATFLRKNTLDLIKRQKAEIEKKDKLIEIADKMVESLKAEVKRLQKKQEAKCGTCYYSKPTTFGKSKCYVECTNQEHIEKYCRHRKISLKRQRTTPACKNYKEMVGDDNG